VTAATATTYLTLTDLDEVAAAAGSIDSAAAEPEFRRVIEEWTDRQAVSNLLWHPELLPDDLAVPALIRALSGGDSYLRLAAAVGTRHLSDSLDEDSPEVHELVAGLLATVGAESGLVARQAAVSLHGLIPADQARSAFARLTHPDPETFRALIAALADLFGWDGLQFLLGDEDFATRETSVRIRDRLATADIGPHDLVPAVEYLPNLAEWPVSTATPAR